MSNVERTRYWELWLGHDDRLDVIRIRSRGRLVHFSLNHRSRSANSWRQVIRYDTHHGRLHVHRFWRAADDQVEYIEQEKGEVEDYEPYFEAAQADIQRNWQRYRSLLAGKKHGR